MPTLTAVAVKKSTTSVSQTMKAAEAPQRFRSILAAAGINLADLTPDAGVRAMLSFYRDVRAVDSQPVDGRDTLLLQWGTYDSGHGRHFELNITRQFIAPSNESDQDDEIWQLSLTFRFVPSSTYDELGRGERWCEGVSGVPAFTRYIEANPAFKAVAGHRSLQVDLEYENPE